MTALRSFLLFALVLSPALAAAKATNTTGVASGGYTFASDVAGYLDVTQDVCAIAEALGAGNWTEAAAIYADGRTSETRSLRGWAQADSTTPTWALYAAYFNDSMWIHTFLEAALVGEGPFVSDDARAQAVKKATQSNLLAAKMLLEVEEAAEEMAAGAKDEAVHKVDEAASLWLGGPGGCATGTIGNVADKRAAAWGTLVGTNGSCTAAANVAAAQAFTTLQKAAQAGDAAGFDAASKALRKTLLTVYLQATLTYARDLEDLVAAGNPTEEASAEGVTFLRTIEPLVEQVDPKQAAAVAGALLAPAAGINTQIQAVLKSAQDALGISAAELGALDAPSACQ